MYRVTISDLKVEPLLLELGRIRQWRRAFAVLAPHGIWATPELSECLKFLELQQDLLNTSAMR
jgi:hypothetical protein